jgi:hypothetical protein
MAAALRGNREMWSILVQHGADTFAKTIDGYAASDCAALHVLEAVIERAKEMQSGTQSPKKDELE